MFQCRGEDAGFLNVLLSIPHPFLWEDIKSVTFDILYSTGYIYIILQTVFVGRMCIVGILCNYPQVPFEAEKSYQVFWC